MNKILLSVLLLAASTHFLVAQDFNHRKMLVGADNTWMYYGQMALEINGKNQYAIKADISSLSSGLYLVNISTTDKRTISTKFVKQ